jgi:hypothetical protein
MAMPAADEKKPFQEKYDARDKLLKLLNHENIVKAESEV